MKDWLRRKFIDWLIHDLFKAVDARDILRIEGTSGYFNDKQIPAETFERLTTDAQRFDNSFLWQVLSRQLRYKASELIAYQSKSPSDMIAGKMLLYWVQVVDDILNQLKKS
jgi:S-adenosylmethionine:diacylglycerol 3-amino-3-carboxypropyl transferase